MACVESNIILICAQSSTQRRKRQDGLTESVIAVPKGPWEGIILLFYNNYYELSHRAIVNHVQSARNNGRLVIYVPGDASDTHEPSVTITPKIPRMPSQVYAR